LNHYAKGKRTEAKAKKYYESLGYEVETVRYDKWRANKDYFGLWDLICVSKKGVVFCQVKANTPPSKKWREEAIAWGPKGNLGKVFIKKEFVVYKDYQKGLKPWKVVTLE